MLNQVQHDAPDGGTANPRTLDEAIDAAPISPVVTGGLAAAAAVMVIDGFDLQAMPITVPVVAQVLAIPPAAFGPTLSAVLVGMGAGAVLLAPLGDRKGRRPLILGGLAAIALATLATATARSLPMFLLWRLVTGLALGICLPNVTALVAELTPRRRRASLLTLTSCGVSIGGLGAGFLIPPLIAWGGWPAPFLASGLFTFVLVGLLWAVLPESPKFYAARAPDQRGYARLVERMGLGDPAAIAAPPERPAKVPMLASLARPYRFATAVFVGLYTLNALALYMLSSWLPTLLPQAGFTLGDASRMAGLVQGGGLIGGFIISRFLDAGRAVLGVTGAYAVVLIVLLAFNLVPPGPLAWGTMLLIVGGGISGAHLALMAVGTSFYPAAVLSAAIGLAVAVARLGAVAGPMLGAQLVASHASPSAFFLVLAVPVLLCGLGAMLIPAAQRAR